MSDTSSHRLKLFRGSGDPGTYVWSPFVTKVEARLRFDGLAYTTGAGSPRSAPRGKIPYIEWQEKPTTTTTHDDGAVSALGDSTLIIRALVADGLLRDVNAALTPAQRARDLAVRALLEDRAYFYGTREKWCDNYQEMVDNMLAAVPWLVRAAVGWMAHRAVVRTLDGQGTGRLSADEVRAFKEEVWEGVEALLAEAKAARGKTDDGEKPFWVLGGEEPSEADATLFGFVVGGLVSSAAPETRAIVKKLPHVMEYAERIHNTYFPDYEKWD